MRLSRLPALAVEKIRQHRFRQQISRLTRQYDFLGYKRFYHYHCRKTAGTSLAKIFMSIAGRDGGQLFVDLGRQSDRPMIDDDLVFVGWNKPLIEQGDYFFGFSHFPFDEVNVPDGTFRFTSFREPADRVFSHYRMLLDFAKQKVPHPCFAVEGQWLGDSFDEFLERIPKEHLLNQLFMFSNTFDVNQAVNRILELDFCFFVEQFRESLNAFNRKTSLSLFHRHDRRTDHQHELTKQQRAKLRAVLDDEYRMLEKVQSGLQQRSAA